MAIEKGKPRRYLSSDYKQYKDDTTKIAAWLISQARRCNYPKDLLDSGLEKRSDSTCLVRVKHFMTLAHFVVSKPGLQIPPSFATVLDRVITVRKRHSLWFSGAKADTKRDLNHEDGHEYFIGVLENVRQVLSPYFERVYDSASPKDSPPSVDEELPISNLFANLEVYDVDETDELINRNIPETTANQKGDSQDGMQPIEYRIADSEWEDAVFAAHLVFKELSKLQEYIHEIWYDYGHEKIDLIAAAITTNSALELASRLGEDFAADFPNTPIEQVMMAFYCVECEKLGLDPRGGLNYEVYGAAQWVFIPVYILLSSFKQVLSDSQHIVPMAKPGYFGQYNPKYNNESAEESFENQKILTGELLQDFIYLARALPSFPFQDEITRGFREMSSKGKITLGFMFAYQIFLDQQEIFGSNCNALWDLQQSARKIHRSFSAHFAFHKQLTIKNWPSKNDDMIRSFLSEMEKWAMTDFIGDGINKMLRRNGLPTRDEHFVLLSKHPTLCGLLAFRFNMHAYEAGIGIANAWGSILYNAHLYNACRQENIVGQPWLDLEFVLSVQNQQKLFVGDPPTDFDGYLKRFSLAMGHSAQDILPGPGKRRSRSFKPSPNGPRSLDEKAIATCYFFVPRYGAEHPITVDLASDAFVSIAEQVSPALISYFRSLRPQKRPLAKSKSKSKSKSKQQTVATSYSIEEGNESVKLSPLELLDLLFISLSSEMDALKFDYALLHRLCWIQLKTMQKVCHQRLVRYFEPGYLEDESQLPWTVGYIFMVAAQSDKASQMVFKGQKKHVQTTSVVLHTAGESLSQFMRAFGRLTLRTLQMDAEQLEAFWRDLGLERSSLY